MDRAHLDHPFEAVRAMAAIAGTAVSTIGKENGVYFKPMEATICQANDIVVENLGGRSRFFIL